MPAPLPFPPVYAIVEGMRIPWYLRRVACPAAAAIAVAACQPAADDGAERTNQATTAALKPPLSIVDPPMDRTALLLAIADARSAAALGHDDREAQRQLDGDRFEVRVRFGCTQSDERAGEEAFQVQVATEGRALRLRAAPNIAAEAWIAPLGGEDIEAVEGFWIPRPWLLQEGCPVEAAERQSPDVPSGSAPASEANEPEIAPAAETGTPAGRAGLAQLFARSDARTGRRDHRAYETTVPLSAEEQPSGGGYVLVLSGRLKQLPGGRVIACRAEDANRAPDCIVSVVFDRVRFERPDNRKILAEWSS